MSLDLLNRLTGDDSDFARGLVELGWYDYAPVLTDSCFMGKARACLDPQFRAAGEVRDTDAWVYRLDVATGRWQDAVAIVESHLKQEPQFAVVFCSLPGALLILVPSNPDKAFGKAKGGLTVDRIFLDTRRPSNFEAECIKKLKEAPKKQFRARLQEMVNTERVTKKFYGRFKKELDSFQKLIDGITVDSDRLWYSSVMLNRLMFIYFLQRKGFLDGDRDYLRNRLDAVQKRRGKDEFQSFYRCFLLRLFHEGLGSRKRERDFEDLLGRIPYLNGGLFEVHEIESRYVDAAGETVVDIPDDAFKKVFSFFSDYEWCLDTRPARTETEINPDVLGYIFEKYINQKQMGAYYTKEDITEYISKNTIIPYIFDTAEKKHRAAFEGDDSVWLLLQIDPDRYIYDAVQKGVELDLPEDIACGLADVSKRDKWNTPAPEEYALPTEIWREVVARRKRYAEVRGKLERGEVKSIDDLITLNLNITRFARDVVDLADGPELIRAIWNTMAGRLPEIGTNVVPIPAMTVLDPTCGSGAFLFAALNILEPLYEGCLKRMQAFVAQADSTGDSRKYPDFRSILFRMNDTAKHPNREYFILKSIILNNLYGVDIMEEAVEICKLRLFLKMASVVEPDETRDNYGLEPLPDIDFNIRAGNTLVGFATHEQVKKAVTRTLDLDDAMSAIEEKAEIAEQAYGLFRRQQVELGGDVTTEDKKALRARLGDLGAELNRYLARQYVIDAVHHKEKYEKWLASHQPFHWFVEFYGIMRRGGFDVIIGNPPYKELAAVRNYSTHGLTTVVTKNLYPLVLERCVSLGTQTGRQGFIVPVSSVSTEGYATLQTLLKRRDLHFSSFDDRPSRLFDGLEHVRLTIHLLGRYSDSPIMHSTRYNKWYGVERPILFAELAYSRTHCQLVSDTFPKLCSHVEHGILGKLCTQKTPLCAHYRTAGTYPVHYSRKVGYFLQILDFEPEVLDGNGQLRPPSEFKTIRFPDAAMETSALCCLNSSLFYWFVTAFSDCRHLNKREVDAFPIDLDRLASSDVGDRLTEVHADLMSDFREHSEHRNMKFAHDILTVQCIIPKFSKPIIDEIDRVLAKHYGFTDEELDFIINYDIKYRMGINGGGDVEEDKE